MSLLDNDDILFQNTGLEAGFPEKKDVNTDWGSPWRTKYYAWENPILISAIENYATTEKDKNVFSQIKTILVVWSLIKNEEYWKKDETKIYEVKIYIADKDKEHILDGYCDYIAFSKNHDYVNSYQYDYTECRAKTLAYKTLLAIKEDPAMILKFVHEPYPRIEDVLKEKGILK